MKHFRLLFVLTSVAAAAAASCALTFEPGDYAGPIDTSISDASADGVAQDVISSGETGPQSGGHFLVLASERDPVGGGPTVLSDVFVGDLDGNGNVSSWTYGPPAPYRESPRSYAVIGDRLFIVSQNPNGRFVESVAYKTAATSTWTSQQVEQPPYGDFTSVLTPTALLAMGGIASFDNDGSIEMQLQDGIFVVPFDPAKGMFQKQIGSLTKLPRPTRYMPLLSYKNFVYLVGGEGQSSSKVEVARTDPANGVTAFQSTMEIMNPATMQPYAPPEAMLVTTEGRFWVIGGNGTDIVVSSPINETDGTLGPWVAAAKLPGPLRGAGVVVLGGSIYLIGGYGSTSRTDRVLRATIKPDGTTSEWDTSSSAKLPSPRSGIVAIAY